MTAFDLMVIGVVGLSTVFAFWRGFVRVTASLAAAEDDEGVGVLMGAGRDLMEEVLRVGEVVSAEVEIAAEERGGPCG